MRAGLFERAFPDGLDLASCFALARQASFEGVELALHDTAPLLPEAQNETTAALIKRNAGLDRLPLGGLRLDSTTSEIEAIARLARDAGLVVTGLSTMQLAYYPLSSPIPAVRERALELVRRMVVATALMGGDVVQVVPGVVTPDEPYQDVWRRSYEALSLLLPYAQQHGVSLAVENVWNRFLLSPLEYRDYVDSFHSPALGAYFDVGNVLRFGFPEHWIELLGPRVMRVHFKDYRLDVDNFGGFAHLLQGDVRWPQVMRALHRVGYDGWAIVEVPPYRSCPGQAILDSGAALRRLLALDV